ncbi:MAG: hypothetical protein IPG54_09350 [Sphingomonadales bacterium]|nr:hypothetical protein [Sphingomonadales bacterium]
MPTASTYNDIYNRLVALFPAVAANYGKPISYRWRCTVCEPRDMKPTPNISLPG